jgi:hypothetical protein
MYRYRQLALCTTRQSCARLTLTKKFFDGEQTMMTQPSCRRWKICFVVLRVLATNVYSYVPRHVMPNQRSGHNHHHELLRRPNASLDDKEDPGVLLLPAGTRPSNEKDSARSPSMEREQEPSPLSSLASRTDVDDDDDNVPFDWDTFLDTPFFDPIAVTNDQAGNPLLRRLALFIQNDYNKAEMVLSGAFLFVMIVVSQELVRFQIHGDSYVPFVGGGGGSSSLF